MIGKMRSFLLLSIILRCFFRSLFFIGPILTFFRQCLRQPVV
ncbi:hypothetical protein imdm_196 [gamma proteobacterium IMCC2047]|nr:hypothetical protein imdm_196 [gamma proteobacterium IMCC2047]